MGVDALLDRRDDEREAALAWGAARHPRDLPAPRRQVVRVDGGAATAEVLARA